MTIGLDLKRALSAIKDQRFGDATPLLFRAVDAQPDNTHVRWLLVQCLEGEGKTDDALEQLCILLTCVREDLSAIDRIAEHLRHRRYTLDPVLQAYKTYLERRPDAANAAFNYGYNLSRDGQFEEAIELYERSLEMGISAPEEVHLNIANIYMDHLDDHGRARAHLERALQLNPGYSRAYYNLGNLAEREGKRDEARRNFANCLRADPTNESALARLADTRKFSLVDDPLLVRLVDTARISSNSDVHFSLGRAYEQLADFDKAWQHFSRGNALDRGMLPAYDRARSEAAFRYLKARCDRDWFGNITGTSTAPVFICGMFRSGSTLLEQMLASHPAFVAGGESEFFPRLVAREFPDFPFDLDRFSTKKLDSWQERHTEQTMTLHGEASRLTDKRPDNFLYIGLIKSVLPSAKFVVTDRDWRDIATSIYSVRLGPSQAYSTNLQDIRHYIDLQSELVDHWEEMLGSDLVRVSYEDLVRHPRTTVGELLEWFGEAWDERCLSFHELNNNVRTASVWQVREPLHCNSIGRWQNYQRQFVDAFGSDLNA